MTAPVPSPFKKHSSEKIRLIVITSSVRDGVISLENIAKGSEIFVAIAFVASISSPQLQKLLSIKVLLMGVTWVKKCLEIIWFRKFAIGAELLNSGRFMLKSPMIYVLLFGSSEEMIVSKAAVKFSTLISTLYLYTKPTVIMPLGVFKSAKNNLNAALNESLCWLYRCRNLTFNIKGKSTFIWLVNLLLVSML